MKSDFEVTEEFTIETRTEYCKHCKEEQVFTKHWTGAWIDVHKHEWTWIGSLSYWVRFFVILGMILSVLLTVTFIVAVSSWLLVNGYQWVLLTVLGAALVIGITFFFTTILGY